MSERWKRVSGWSEGDDDRYPHFGKKARAWFKRRLWVKLEVDGVRSQYRLDDAEFASLAERIAAEAEIYVWWHDDEEFHGRHYSNGSWKIEWKKIDRAIVELIHEIRSDAARAAVPTLEDWLRADLHDTLEYSITGGSAQLPKKLRKKLTERARARRRSWPLGCTECGKTFYRGANQRGKPIRCPECLLSRKWMGM